MAKTIWLFYARDAYTTARHMDAALRKAGHKVLSFGPNNQYATDTTVSIPDLMKKFSPPDMMLNMDGCAVMNLLGIETFPGPKGIYVIDTHLNDNRIHTLYGYDRLFVCHRATVLKWADTKPGWIHWIPPAADPEVHREIPNVPTAYDVAFVGGVDLSEVHHKRRDYLEALVKDNVRLYAGRTTGLFMSFIYSKSLTVFNCSIKEEINMRMMEALAVKRVLLTNKILPEQGFTELGFKDGENCLVYDSVEGLRECVKLALTNKKKREAIAAAGYELFTKRHTYDHRITEMLNAMEGVVDKKPDAVKA